MADKHNLILPQAQGVTNVRLLAQVFVVGNEKEMLKTSKCLNTKRLKVSVTGKSGKDHRRLINVEGAPLINSGKGQGLEPPEPPLLYIPVY